jgi:hypothetical protein
MGHYMKLSRQNGIFRQQVPPLQSYRWNCQLILSSTHPHIIKGHTNVSTPDYVLFFNRYGILVKIMQSNKEQFLDAFSRLH